MARPSLLTEDLIEKMSAEIADGLPICYACDLFSVTEQSYFNWMEQGKHDFENNIDSIYATFFDSIKKSCAQFIVDAKKRIKSGIQGWQGTAWWLERTNNKFMPKQQIQADDDGKVNVIIGGKIKDIKNGNNK